MVYPGDLVVLFGVLEASPGWTLRSLAGRLGVPHAKVQRALDRLADGRLYDATRRRPRAPALEEFVVHALKYIHPIEEGRLSRGVPTAWGTAPLKDEIAASDSVPVWPHPRGEVRGPAVEPLDPRLPDLASEWPQVAELAALCDALLLGDARVRSAAERHLHGRIATRR